MPTKSERGTDRPKLASTVRLDAPLPPRGLRMGGRHFMDDRAMLTWATSDVRRLQVLCHLTEESRIVDWGCGAGRLASGLLASDTPFASYEGIDVQERVIAWAQENLTDPRLRWTHVNVANSRYNPNGTPTASIPVADHSVDVFYAYSVWSHLDAEDSAAYLRELARILASGGRALFTCFVEHGVPDAVENPDGYGPMAWDGPLHCVRFSKDYFDGLIAAAGLEVEYYAHGRETDGQSLYVVRRSPIFRAGRLSSTIRRTRGKA